MKRIERDRHLTPEEAERYRAMREDIAEELPELVDRHTDRTTNGQVCLLPDEGIALLTHGDDCARFVKNFRHCWARIPEADRDTMLAYWASFESELSPRFEFSNCGIDAADCFGQVDQLGQQIRFSARAFGALGDFDGVARWIIAHALAHVMQWTVGRTPEFAITKDHVPEFVEGSVEAHERDANGIAKNWGFDQTPDTLLQVHRSREKLDIAGACQEMRLAKQQLVDCMRGLSPAKT